MDIKITTRSGREHLLHITGDCTDNSTFQGAFIEKIRDQLLGPDKLLTVYENGQLKAVFVKKFIESISVCED